MPQILEMREIDGRLAVFLDMPPNDPSPVTLWTEAEKEAAFAAVRKEVYRELLSDDYDMNSSMLMTAGKIPLERENGGLEYPAIKVFREMLKTAAKVRGVNL